MMEHLYRKCEDAERGRHLVAASNIAKGQVILTERPLLALQSVGNSPYTLVCRNCRAFVGGPQLSLGLCSGRIGRQSLLDKHPSSSSLPPNKCNTVVPCRHACGEVFCSKQCEKDMFEWGGHEWLCTGLIPEPEEEEANDKNEEDEQDQVNHNNDDEGEKKKLHPLLEFKLHAVKNNEIFLLVADLIASVVSIRCRQMRVLGEDSQPDTGSLDAILAPYLDFTQVPWWTVATARILSSPMGLVEASGLDLALRRLCSKSASLLKEAFLVHYSNSTNSNVDERSNTETLRDVVEEECSFLFEQDFFGRIIGTFEQNAIGIRARHPLCRSIFDPSLRIECHDDVVKCIENAGFIGDCGADDNDDEQDEEIAQDENSQNIDDEADEEDYTVAEIASFLAELKIDEIYGSNESSKIDQGDDKEEAEDTEGDDLDLLFTPLDGTALYYTACKMNHSCDPNTVAGYQTSGFTWGKEHPLVLQCVALRDISKGDELCISYIANNEPLQQRQEQLSNYGFDCRCSKCMAEMHMDSADDQINKYSETRGYEDDIFGDSEEDESVDAISLQDDESTDEDKKLQEGETALQNRLAQIYDVVNTSPFGQIPVPILAQVASFVLRVGAFVEKHIVDTKPKSSADDSNPLRGLGECLEALERRNFVECTQLGTKGEEALFSILQHQGSWPTTSFREAYGCYALISAIGYANDGSFIRAMCLVDKALILGVSRGDVHDFYEYVEYHAAGCMRDLRYQTCTRYRTISDYSTQPLKSLVEKTGLSKPILYPMEEVNGPTHIEYTRFHDDFVSRSKLIVIREFATKWPAIQKWRDLDLLDKEHGHRTVPIELGSMLSSSGMTERLMSVQKFVESYLSPSADKVCHELQSTQSGKVAYMAQHQLLEQLPSLKKDIDINPSFCGEKGPTHVNAWLGTGGTRTPLHFDTYDNLFVQIVGVKYVRIYANTETPKLYVQKKSNNSSDYSSQGNMSSVDCELEDFEGAHPLAREAKYEEVIMFPGDCLFIPARAWHYVRGLSTSFSVNFWF